MAIVEETFVLVQEGSIGERGIEVSGTVIYIAYNVMYSRISPRGREPVASRPHVAL